MSRRALRALALLVLSRAAFAARASPSSPDGSPADLLGSSSAVDDLVDVPFTATPIAGLDARDPSVSSIPTTVPGGELRWRGGFDVNFTGLDPDGRPWLNYGGWSSLVGSPDGTRLWTLTDNYARLLRVVVDADPATGFMTAVRSVQNATFAIRTPSDPSRVGVVGVSEEGAEYVETRIDVESLVAIPRARPGADPDSNPRANATDALLHHPADEPTPVDDGLDDATNELEDFVVGVEDSWELPANNLIRFRDGRRRAWTDLPGADAALDACDANLGPESLIWLPPTSSGGDPSRAGSNPIPADRATLVTFCETPTSDAPPDVVRGFVFDVSDDASDDDALLGEIFLRGVGQDCGLSDATVTPDGAHALFLYHCYTYPPGSEGVFGTGDHHTEIRVAPVARLRNLGATVDARLLVKWSGAEGCPMTNMEGIHAFEGGAEADGDDRGVDVILVSDNNLVPEQPTQIVRLNVAGGVYAEDDSGSGGPSEGVPKGAELGRAAEGSVGSRTEGRWSRTAAAAAAVVVAKIAAAGAFVALRLRGKHAEETNDDERRWLLGQDSNPA